MTDRDNDLEARRAEEQRFADANDDIPSEGWQGGEEDDSPPPRQDDRDEDHIEEPKIVYGSRDDDLAEEISQKQLAEREDASREYDNDPSKRSNFMGVFGDGEDDDAPPAGEQPPQEQHQTDDPMVETIVRGQKVLRPLSEVVALAQKTEAADTYLADARRFYDEARAELERVRAGGQPLTEAQHREAERGLTEQQRAERRNMHEVITYGTPEEIDAAFAQRDAELVDRATRAVENRMRAAGRDSSFKESFEEGIRYVEQVYPDLAGRQHLTDALMANVVRAQKEAMAITVENLSDAERAKFARVNVTPDRLRAMTSPTRVSEVFRDFHRQGYTLPPIDVLMKKTAEFTAQTAGIQPRNVDPAGNGRPTTPGSDQNRGRVQLSRDRQERKQELTPQTARASAGPGRTSAPREQSERDWHKSAMADYRDQGQGFTVPSRRR